MTPFGQTPREAIAEAFRNWGSTFAAGRRAFCPCFEESDLLNLLDVLAAAYENDEGAASWGATLPGWARDLRISILATLGLEER